MVVSVKDMDNGVSTFALTISAGGFDPAGDQPSLVFTKDQTEYRLSQIWESTMTGRELTGLPRSKRVGQADAPTGVVAYVIDAERK
jgi:hypothetical protein